MNKEICLMLKENKQINNSKKEEVETPKGNRLRILDEVVIYFQ